jgi:hypothetical protein
VQLELADHLGGLTHRIRVSVSCHALERRLERGSFRRDFLEAVTSARSLELVREVGHPLERRAILLLECSADLIDLRSGLGQKLALQFVEFKIHISFCRRTAARGMPDSVGSGSATMCRYDTPMMPPRPLLRVPRAAFSIEDPWAVPAACQPAPLVASESGTAPRLETRVAAYHDDGILYVLFSGADEGDVVATMLQRDDPLYEEDVVELFLAPAEANVYFEIEISPAGTIFDARIVSPLGVREGMRVDLSWNCEGITTMVRVDRRPDGRGTLETLICIPFQSLVPAPPLPRSRWGANFFRIDRSREHGDEYLSWQPTLKDPADFHVVSAFGELEFD